MLPFLRLRRVDYKKGSGIQLKVAISHPNSSEKKLQFWMEDVEFWLTIAILERTKLFFYHRIF